MTIGDAFTVDDLSAFEWASFAKAAGLPGALVRRQLKRLAERVLIGLPDIGDSGMPDEVKGRLCEVIGRNCERQLAVGGCRWAEASQGERSVGISN